MSERTPLIITLANAALRCVGLVIVERRCGWWFVGPNRTIDRTSFHVGWRLTTTSEASRARPGETELDRFIRRMAQE